MKYEFLVQVTEDGSISFSQKYTSAVDAVRAYDSFRDYGTCKYWREIVLVEPNGKGHGKMFEAPELRPSDRLGRVQIPT
jgi:hypothetical protein